MWSDDDKDYGDDDGDVDHQCGEGDDDQDYVDDDDDDDDHQCGEGDDGDDGDGDDDRCGEGDVVCGARDTSSWRGGTVSN